jgi:hypothetical protein
MTRLIVMTILQILLELTRRLGHEDLAGQCVDCQTELKAAEKVSGDGG